jgi:uncharacterized protein (TIGR02246 family)
MTTANSSAVDQAQIVKLIDHWVNATRNRDVEGSLSNYAKNVTLFDVVEPLQYFGLDAVRRRLSEWFSTFQDSIGYEMNDLRIATDGDVAFSHSLNHVNGTMADGTKLDMWWRQTICYRKMNEQWMVTHAHNSVPFDVKSGKALLDLRP